jgi:hypothetical protein
MALSPADLGALKINPVQAGLNRVEMSVKIPLADWLVAAGHIGR